MSTSTLCPGCRHPLPPGMNGRCRNCRRRRSSFVSKSAAKAPPKPRSSVAFGLTVAAHVLALALVIGLAVWGITYTLRSKQAAARQSVASAPATSIVAPPPEIVPQDNSVAESLPAPADEAVAVATELAPMPSPLMPSAVELAPPPTPLKEDFPRRSKLAEFALQKQLADMKEFGLPMSVRPGLVNDYATQYRTSSAIKTPIAMDPFTLLSHFPKAIELQIRSVPRCQLGPKEAVTLGILARKLHAYLDIIAPMDINGKRSDPTQLRNVLRAERRGKRPEWLRTEAIPAMIQILMAEDTPFRLL